MTSSVRYKYVKNQTTEPLTADNFVSNCFVSNDGDDKQYKFVKRIVTAADIGTDPGQIGNVYGAILDMIPITSDVLWFEANVYRAVNIVNSMTPYQNLDGDIPEYPAATQSQLLFGLGLDGSIRAIDKVQGTAAAIAIGDIITAKIIIGTRQFTSDVMNP